MINVSREFQQLMNQRTDFKENAEITFVNGTTIELSEKDFTISNNNIVDSSETNGIPLGVAVCRSIQIELMNDDDRFSEYDFFGAKIHLYLTFQLSETVEKVEYGTFTVLTPETYGETVIITALDDMYKADASYQTSLLFPATLRNVLIDACTTVGISLGSTTFINDDFAVQSKPVDLTYRELFGYIAMIAGGNARIDTSGRLRIISYNFSELENVYDGGSFKLWNNPTDLDGGSFNPWDIGDIADGGTFGDRKGIHVLNNWKNLKVDTDDVVITGVSLTYTDSNNEEKTIMHGVEGYVLNVKNPLIAEKDIALIGNIMVGGRFRQFSGDLVANPTCEFMDTALISDRKGNVYISFLTDINFQFFGFTTLKNSANPALRNSAKTYSEATKTLVAARKLIKNERTAREQAVAQLAKDLKNSSGLFMTEDVQPDGSTIYYMHDKPTLAESMIVWKLTLLAFGVSTDGGETYPYGFTLDGETITRILYAVGINADYINTGAIRIANTNGNTMFLADYNTKQVYINADNVKIGSQNVQSYINSMISATKNEIRLEVTERTSIYNEEINTLQGGMDGNIDLSFFNKDHGTIVTTMSGKQCIYNGGYSFYQDVSIPSGTYKFSYEWLRNISLHINANVEIYDLSISYDEPIYSKDLGAAWPETNVWKKEEYQFILDKTSRIRFITTFSAPIGYEDRINSLYLTNIALYGTAQSVADAISDVKSELLIQSDSISSKVSKNNIISEINQTAEQITINASKIDLVGLVNAKELVSKYATIDQLNATNIEVSGKATIGDLNATSAYLENVISSNISAVSAEIESLRANKIDASTVKADYMEVANWTAGGKIRADRIDANEIASRFSESTELRAGIIVGSSITTLGSFNVGNYSFSPQYSTTLHQYILIGKYIGA